MPRPREMSKLEQILYYGGAAEFYLTGEHSLRYEEWDTTSPLAIQFYKAMKEIYKNSPVYIQQYADMPYDHYAYYIRKHIEETFQLKSLPFMYYIECRRHTPVMDDHNDEKLHYEINAPDVKYYDARRDSKNVIRFVVVLGLNDIQLYINHQNQKYWIKNGNDLRRYILWHALQGYTITHC